MAAYPDPRTAQSLLDSRPPPHSLLRPLPPRPPEVLCSKPPPDPLRPYLVPRNPAISPNSRACPCRSCHRPRALSTLSSSRNLSHPLQGLPSPLLRCPSQRLLDRVVRRYAEVADAGSIFMDHFTDRDKLRLLYTLAVNAHPILLQVCRDPPPRESPSRERVHFRLRGSKPWVELSLPSLHTLGPPAHVSTFVAFSKYVLASAVGKCCGYCRGERCGSWGGGAVGNGHFRGQRQPGRALWRRAALTRCLKDQYHMS